MREISWKYINIFTLLRDLVYSWWIILLSAVIGFCSYTIYNSVFLVDQYTSSMTIAVNLSGFATDATATSLSRTIMIADAFEDVLNSDTMVSIVERELGESVSGTFSAVKGDETNLITLSVTDTSPQKAYTTLKTVYDNHNVLTDSAFNNVIITVVSNPNMPSTPSNIKAVVSTAIITAAVFMLGSMLIILIISYFRDTVKNVSDVENLLDTKLFAAVSHVNKRKSKIKKSNDGLIFTNPLINYEFANSFREMAIKLISLKRTKKIRSVMLTSISENEGKTTVSVNLAIALAEAGMRVALVDSDLKLPALYKFFQRVPLESENEIGSYINGETDYDSIIRQDKRTGVYLVGGKKKHYNSSNMLNSDNFKGLIHRLERDFDIVIVDTPPGGITVDAEIILESVSGMLFVVRQDYAPVELINDYISNIESEKMLGCIFNDVSQMYLIPKSFEYGENNH